MPNLPNLQLLKPFLVKAAGAKDLQVKKKATAILDEMVAEQAQEPMAAPALQGTGVDAANKTQNKDEVDALILPAFPHLAQQDQIDSSFGKVASAYITDVPIRSLPKDTQADIEKLMPVINKNALIIQYGMVFTELLNKVDKHNFALAEAHIKEELARTGKRALSDKFQDKVKTKYILLLNDSIIDGNHFLAMTKALDITCSLKVLDLTPLRFQQTQKRASLLSQIQRQG